MILMRNLLGAILAISAVQASPHDNIDVRAAHLRSRSISGHNCVDFGTGGPNGYVSFGNVCVDVSSTSITVTYPTLPSGDSYSAAHLYLGTSAPTNSAPGQFPYNSYCTVSGTSASCTVPLSALKFSLTCSSTLYVAAQADVTGSVGAGTGWGGKQGTAGVTNIDASCNPNANCARYWSFSVSCQCPVVTTYEAATCTSTITTTTAITVQNPPLTSGSTSCNDPGTTSTVTVDGGKSTCTACAAPYFCGCS